jgi:Mn2+/Fe2+ NRAMP family transporter
MVATTFSVAAAFYQAYQVREKGWTQKDLAVGRLDSVVGIGALGLITMMILICGAAALYGIDPATLTDAAAVAIALEPLFGDSARYVFAIGVLAGAVSSFLVNALIGAVVFCDAINQPTSLSQPVVRTWTVIALLLGWAVASFAIIAKIELANFIVFAQCLTVVAIPVLGITIIWQARKLPSGTLPRWVMPVNYVGLLVVLALAARTVIKLVS